MNCDHVSELLPWFMNGTLTAEEQQQVREHLAQCATCRQEHTEKTVIIKLFRQHVPTEVLVDYALERPVEPVERDLIERHLKTCSTCAKELALAQEGRRSLEEAPVEAETPLSRTPSLQADWTEHMARLDAQVVLPGLEGEPAQTTAPWWRVPRWSWAALAASLVGLLLAGGWLWTWQRARTLQAQLQAQVKAASEQLTTLRAENQRLRGQQDQAHREMAQLSERIRALRSPSLNVAMAVIHAQGTRATPLPKPESRQAVAIPPDAPFIALGLHSVSPARYKDYSIEVVNAENRVIWSAQGLQYNAKIPGYTLMLPTELLPPGHYVLSVYGKANGQRVPVDRYLITVVTPS